MAPMDAWVDYGTHGSCMVQIHTRLTTRGESMADFDHEIISRGNCTICGKPIDIDNIFLCSECMRKARKMSESATTKKHKMPIRVC